jgi:hypothetical protein
MDEDLKHFSQNQLIAEVMRNRESDVFQEGALCPLP